MMLDEVDEDVKFSTLQSKITFTYCTVHSINEETDYIKRETSLLIISIDSAQSI